MKFKSELNINPSSTKISYQDNIFFIGSCFSENISTVLKNRKFTIHSNPFGIVYNPISVLDNLSTSFHNKKTTEKDLFLHNELWKSFSFHSNFSSENKIHLLNKINDSSLKAQSFLKKSNVIFITFGTAWVYEYKQNIVANCHKVSKEKFKKRLLTIAEIVKKAKTVFSEMFENNQNLNICLTISPVRHLKDGFIENNQSKSVLQLAIKELCENHENITYFPSYEFVIDDLRDYRFYKEDFVHPNSLAIKYIIEKFDEHFFDSSTLQTIKKIEKLKMSLNHKVLKPNTKEHLEFKAKLKNQMLEFEKQGFDFSVEKNSL